MSDETYASIKGTAGLPDNRIHRASLWLERVRFGERAFTDMTDVESGNADTLGSILGELNLDDLTPEDLHHASLFYGRNLAVSLFGGTGRIILMLPNPIKGEEDQQVTLDYLLAQVWRDAWEHGAAAALGKHAFTAAEVEEREREK